MDFDTMKIVSSQVLLMAVIACCMDLSQSFLPTVLPYAHPAEKTTQWRIDVGTSLSAVSVVDMPRINDAHLAQLESQNYVVIPDFLPSDLQADLRRDVTSLQSSGKFKVAKIGQDSTNALNQDIRVAETCFLGPNKLQDVPSDARQALYRALDQVRSDLPGPLDPNLTELLYTYYPKGGFYRRHVDALPGSASVLRSYSLLLYLNENWTPKDGGQLLLHFDSGGDALPEGEKPDFVQVEPRGGTLVLFQSDAVPHEVLDTNAERLAVVGWYNRPLSASDISSLGGIDDSLRPVLLGISAALLTVGLYTLLQS